MRWKRGDSGALVYLLDFLCFVCSTVSLVCGLHSKQAAEAKISHQSACDVYISLLHHLSSASCKYVHALWSTKKQTKKGRGFLPTPPWRTCELVELQWGDSAVVTVQPSSAVGALSSYHIVPHSVPPVSAGCVPYGISHHLVTLRPGPSSSRCRFTSKTGQQLLNWATYLMSRCFILLASTAAKPFAIVVFTIIIRCHKGF